MMQTPGQVSAALTELSKSVRSYGEEFLAIRLAPHQIANARDLMLNMRNSATVLLDCWRDFNVTRVGDQNILNILDTSQGDLKNISSTNRDGSISWLVRVGRTFKTLWQNFFPPSIGKQGERVSNVLPALMNVVKIGSELSKNLESAIQCASHYQRQCSYLENEPETRYYQDDASELKASLEQVALHVSTDIDSRNTDIDLLNVYSQTVLTGEVRKLTAVLVRLTSIIVILSMIAAAAGLLAVIRT